MKSVDKLNSLAGSFVNFISFDATDEASLKSMGVQNIWFYFSNNIKKLLKRKVVFDWIDLTPKGWNANYFQFLG